MKNNREKGKNEWNNWQLAGKRKSGQRFCGCPQPAGARAPPRAATVEDAPPRSEHHCGAPGRAGPFLRGEQPGICCWWCFGATRNCQKYHKISNKDPEISRNLHEIWQFGFWKLWGKNIFFWKNLEVWKALLARYQVSTSSRPAAVWLVSSFAILPATASRSKSGRWQKPSSRHLTGQKIHDFWCPTSRSSPENKSQLENLGSARKIREWITPSKTKNMQLGDFSKLPTTWPFPSMAWPSSRPNTPAVAPLFPGTAGRSASGHRHRRQPGGCSWCHPPGADGGRRGAGRKSTGCPSHRHSVGCSRGWCSWEPANSTWKFQDEIQNLETEGLVSSINHRKIPKERLQVLAA